MSEAVPHPLAEPVMIRNGVDQAAIRRLVDTFYTRARADPVIGPIFQSAVQDWEHHLASITAFWSSVLLRSGDYGGRPLRPHLLLRLEGQHFDRWLALFEATAREQWPPEAAALIISRARRIADSFEMAIGSHVGEIRPPRHSV
jgi:hemoglobin